MVLFGVVSFVMFIVYAFWVPGRLLTGVNSPTVDSMISFGNPCDSAQYIYPTSSMISTSGRNGNPHDSAQEIKLGRPPNDSMVSCGNPYDSAHKYTRTIL